jgi:recombinational DNA repair protein RecT
MAEEKKQDLQKVNPLKQFEQQVALAKNVKDILKIDVVKNRYVANYSAISGRQDGLQAYEQESFAFIELVNNKPEIMECDPFSIVAGFLRGSSYALSFAGNHLSVYPRNVKQRDGSYKKVLIVEPQAHGKRRLLEKMPAIKEIMEGVLVFKDEEFIYDRKQKKVLSHKSKWPEPEPSETTVVGAYCTVKFQDGTEREVVVTQTELKKARAASKMNEGGDLWIKYYGEACKKTTYNRAFKVYWDKPQTDKLFSYTVPDDSDGGETVDAASEDVSAADPTMIDQAQPAAEQKDDFKSNVNESTGEVYEEAKVVEKSKKKTEPFI